MFGLLRYCFFLVFLVSCGTGEGTCGLDAECAAQKQAQKDAAAGMVQDFVIRGSVNSAFALTVDGQDYDDIESYFTAESARLPSKVKDAGYEGYTVRFDAAIGFNDLTQGMTVYIAGKEKRGYQTKTLIAKNDTFAAKLPAEAAGDVYQIKANKRIGIILTKGSEIKKFCYNFAAVDLEVPYEMVDDPIILSNFKSSLTTYECQQDAGSDSLKVPENSDKPTEYTTTKATTAKVFIHDSLRNQIKPGMTVLALNYILGDIDYKTGDPGIHDRPVGEMHASEGYQVVGFNYHETSGICEAEVSTSIATGDCYYIYDWSKTIIYQQGIRLEYLAPGESWPSLEEAKAIAKENLKYKK
jgi:hypothetical protein